jgi:cation diffusion facilitator CzcD-associated flavoprotein CzcO
VTAPRRVVDGTHVEVAVVGGGQAGLSISWHLTRQGVDHVVLERDTIAHDWIDRRWDAFTLVTPNWQCVLPGFAYDGDDPDGFMGRDKVHTWIRRYAASFDAPVVEGVLVTRLRESAEGGFEVVTDQGTIRADQVVLATGGYHRPVLPAVAAGVSDDVVQVHSADYRSPQALRRAACSWSALASRAPRSRRTCTSPVAGCTSRSARHRAAPASTVAATASPG